MSPFLVRVRLAERAKEIDDGNLLADGYLARQYVALAVDAQKAEDAWKQVLDHGGAIVWTATLDDVPDFPGPERTDFWRALGGCLPPNAVADLEMLETFFDPAAITRASARP